MLTTVLCLTFALYLAAITVAVVKRMPVRLGLAMLPISLLPLAYQAIQARGVGLGGMVAVALLPLPLAMILVGALIVANRRLRTSQSSRT